MRVPKQLSTIVIAAAVAGVVSFGAGAVVEASATGSSVTYQACVSKTGAMSKVGTVTPTCPATSHVISWNSQGPDGAPGTPGTPGANGVAYECGATPYPGIDLAGCDMTGVYLINPNLTGANLTGAILGSAILGYANLTGANLYGANLTGANLYGANLTNTRSGGIIGTPIAPSGVLVACGYLYGPGVNLSGGVCGASMQGVNLSGADLSGFTVGGDANIASNTWVTLSDVNLSGANLYGADLTYAILDNANLTGADLSYAVSRGGAQVVSANLTNANLTGIAGGVLLMRGDLVWSNTTCPDGTNSSISSPQTCIGHGI